MACKVGPADICIKPNCLVDLERPRSSGPDPLIEPLFGPPDGNGPMQKAYKSGALPSFKNLFADSRGLLLTNEPEHKSIEQNNTEGTLKLKA